LKGILWKFLETNQTSGQIPLKKDIYGNIKLTP
jgi:hypothetical protein